MEKRYRLEPFDIERAKAGEPVCTRDGDDAKIIYWERKSNNFPIIAIVGESNNVFCYSIKGEHNIGLTSSYDLVMKVEVKESYIYADVAGEITPFETLKEEGFIDLKSLEYLIIKTYDGKFLKIWKRDLPEQEWEDAQKKASEIGEGWRCPTRHECIDIYDARFKGLDDAMKEIGGDTLKDIYWTSEADSDPQYYANDALCFDGYTGNLSTDIKYVQSSVRPVHAFSIDSNSEIE